MATKTTKRKAAAKKAAPKATAARKVSASVTAAAKTNPRPISGPEPQPALTVGKGHASEWPDKLVFAALLLMVAGAFGLLYGLLVTFEATLGANVPGFLRDYPAWAILAGSFVALAAGWAAFRFQWALAGWVGVVAAIASMGFLGLVPLLALIAAGMLLASRLEGEASGFKRYVGAHEWPDKAIMSSLFLLVAGVFTAAQAVAQFSGVFPAMFLPDAPAVWATFSALAAVALVVGGIESFRLRGGRIGTVGAVLGILAAAFYFVGPILAVLALVHLRLAYREGEFTARAAAA